MNVLDFGSGTILSVISLDFPEQRGINKYVFLMGTMRQELLHILFGRTARFRWWKWVLIYFYKVLCGSTVVIVNTWMS